MINIITKTENFNSYIAASSACIGGLLGGSYYTKFCYDTLIQQYKQDNITKNFAIRCLVSIPIIISGTANGSSAGLFVGLVLALYYNKLRRI